MNKRNKLMAALAFSSAMFGAASIVHAPVAEARLCARSNSYCPQVMLGGASYGTLSGGRNCGDFRTSVRPEDAVSTTTGTFGSRSCYSGEPIGNVIGFFQGPWGFAIRWSVNGHNYNGPS